MTLVLLSGLSAGVLQDAHGNVIPGRQINVYARGTSTPVQVYADSAGSSPVTQPLTSDINGLVPGYVTGGVSVDVVDALTGLRAQGEPVSANAVARNIATTYLTPSGGDDSAAMATAVAAGGTIVMGPGTFLWNTQVPAFKRSTPTRVVAAGVGKTIIKLSSGAPRAFDFNKVADYDTFNDIEITDLTVDCNNVGGQHHVIIGTYAAGVQTTKINVARIGLRRLQTLNVPTDPTTVTHRLNIWIYVQVNAADNPCTMNDVTVEDCDFMHGGNWGCGLGGTTNDGTGYGNLIHDRIVIQRLSHDTLLTCPTTTVNGAAQTLSTTPSTLTVASTTNFPAAGTILVATSTTTATVTYTGISGGTSFTGCTVASGSFTATNGGNAVLSSYSSCAVQVGSRDLGLTVTLRDVHSFNAGDVGIALLNTRFGQAFGCTSTDARNLNLQACNFNPNLPADQTHAFWSCHARIVNLRPDGLTCSGAGFGGSGASPIQLGHLLLDGCTVDSLSPIMGTLGQAIQVSALPIAKLTVRDCTYTQRAVNWTMTATSSPVGGLYFNPIAGLGIPAILVVDNFKTDVAGVVTRGGFTFNYRDVFINPGANCEVELACMSHRPNYNVTGVANSTYTACLVGPAAGPSTTTVTATTTNTSATLSSISPAYGIGRGNFLSGTGITTNSGVYSINTNGTAAVMTANASASNSGVTVTVTPFATIYGYWKTLAGVFDGSDVAPNGITVNLAGAIGTAILGSQCFSIPPMEGLHFDGSDFGKYPSGSGNATGGNPNLEIQVGTTNTAGVMPLVTWHGMKMAGNRISEDANSFALANGATTITNQTGRRVGIFCNVAVTVLTITRRTNGTANTVAATPYFELDPGDQAVATTAGGLYFRFPRET